MNKKLAILFIVIFLGACSSKTKTYRYDKSPCKPKKNKTSLYQKSAQGKIIKARGQNIFIECDKIKTI